MKDLLGAERECQRTFARGETRIEIQKDENGLIISERDWRLGNMRSKRPRNEYA